MVIDDEKVGMQAWMAVVEVTKAAMEQNDPPLVWGVDVATCVHQVGIGLPSVELSTVMVDQLLSAAANGAPTVTMWLYIRHAMAAHMVPALHMLALLTKRCNSSLPTLCLGIPRLPIWSSGRRVLIGYSHEIESLPAEDLQFKFLR